LAETDGEIDAFKDQMDMLEEHLSKGHQYFSGEQFGTAGIVLGPNVQRWFHMPVERARRALVQCDCLAKRGEAVPSRANKLRP
jgi:glutathione S-transferase